MMSNIQLPYSFDSRTAGRINFPFGLILILAAIAGVMIGFSPPNSPPVWLLAVLFIFLIVLPFVQYFIACGSTGTISQNAVKNIPDNLFGLKSAAVEGEFALTPESEIGAVVNFPTSSYLYGHYTVILWPTGASNYTYHEDWFSRPSKNRLYIFVSGPSFSRKKTQALAQELAEKLGIKYHDQSGLFNWWWGIPTSR